MRWLQACTVHRWSSLALVAIGFTSGFAGVVLGIRLARLRQAATPAPLLVPAASRGPAANAVTPPRGDVRSLTDLLVAWRHVAAQPDSAVRDAECALLITQLAASAPDQAIALSLAERNLILRQNLLGAALRGWAGVDPTAASNWALGRPLAERGFDVAAVLAGAAVDSEGAIALANRLIAADPALAHDHGCALLAALADRGNFAAAARFASDAPAPLREGWLDLAFTAWAEHQPLAAVAAAASVAEPDRATVFRTVLSRWSAIDAPGAADFALRLDPGAERSFALGSALSAWATQDLPAASAWINQREPTRDLDEGVAAVATSPALAGYRPLVAVNWAESIFAPEVRVQALSRIVQEWARRDADAAMRYLLRSTSFSAADRATLRAQLTPVDGNNPDRNADPDP